ncbi:MAG: iron ABC transporter permease [Candidatus Omnitrophota bacterium]
MKDIRNILEDRRKKSVKTAVILVSLLLAAAFISLYSGPAKIGLFEPLNTMSRQILYMRLFRIMLAVLVGGGLSVAGVILQGLLRNPLCEPYVLGISSGASVGAVASIVLGAAGTFIGLGILPIWAFAGAAVTFFIVYRTAEVSGRVPMQNLLLTGVIAGALLSSIVIFIVSFSQQETLHSIIWWLLGNLQIFDGGLLFFVAVMVVAGTAAAYIFSNELNAFALGEEEAAHIGVDIERMKMVLFLTASMITGAAVSAAGMIGFVGLIVPHFMRMIVGPDHKILIPSSFLAGGIFLLVCDTAARTLMPPAEIPVGVITAVFGAPFFIYMLRKKSRL